MPGRATVAEAVVRGLVAAGAGRVYGIIGTSVLDLVDTLYEHRGRIPLVTARHEQAAASMADAEARATGRLGAAMVHAGPGFLNAALGLGIALRDRVPLVLVTGGVRRRLRGTGAWLEVDQEAVSRGVAKRHILLETAREAPHAVEEAVGEALSPPRGPVVLEVPEDLWREEAELPDGYPSLPGPPGPGEAAEYAREVLDALRDAERPLILACGELALDPRFDQALLERVAERMGAYIVTSGNGRGACSEDHPLCLGRAGFGGGSLPADRALETADLVIVLGNEFDDITTYGYTLLPEGDVLVASLDPLVWSRPAYYEAYKADPVAALRELDRLLEGRGPREPGLRQVVEEAGRAWGRMLEEHARSSLAARFFRELDRLLPRDRIVTAGQGTHVLYAYDYLRVYRPRSFLAATNLGAMSYAFPAAVGASLATGRRVVSVVGDGDFMMAVQDLETARRESAPVSIVVVNDNSYRVLYLRQVIQRQGRIYGTLLGNPDFPKLAESFGVPALRVEEGNIGEAARLAAEGPPGGGPVLIEVPARPDELPPLNLDYTLRMSR